MKKLLLADDSITIQKVVGIIFAQEDYQLLIADDGDSALAKAMAEEPDIVIADISMPGKDGFELCRTIKSEEKLAKTSVLLLPGAFDNFDEAKAEEVCADGWLTKPFESQALIDKVDQLLNTEPLRLNESEKSQESMLAEPQATESLVESVFNSEVAAAEDLAAGNEQAENIWDAVSFEDEDLPLDTGDLSAENDPGVVDFSAFDEESSEDDSLVSNFSAAADDAVAIEEDDVLDLAAVAEDIEELEPLKDVDTPAADFESPEDELEEILGLAEEPTFVETPVDLVEEAEDTLELMTEPGFDEEPKAFERDDAIDLVTESTPIEDTTNVAQDEPSTEAATTDDIIDLASESVLVEDAAPFEEESAIYDLSEEDIVASVDDETSADVDPNITEVADDALVMDDSKEESSLALSDALTTEEEAVEVPEFIANLEDDEDADEDSNESLFESDDDESLTGTAVFDAFAAAMAEGGADGDDSAFFFDASGEDDVDNDQDEEEGDVGFFFSDKNEEDETSSPEMAAEVDVESDASSLHFSAIDEQKSDAVASALTEPEAPTENLVKPSLDEVEQQLRGLPEEELREVVAKVAGPIIEKLASEMLEKISWEVVPDLAEAMIREEIRKIKEPQE
jgi:DNA-binding response OmpR family regulator